MSAGHRVGGRPAAAFRVEQGQWKETWVGLGVQGGPGEGAEGGSWLALPIFRPSPISGSLGLSGLPAREGHDCMWPGWKGLLAITRCSSLLPTVTPSDCYVTLWLPTASSYRLQTHTVKNSRNPVWNQSFRFRIHNQLKVGQEPALSLLSLSTATAPSQPRPTCLPIPPSFLLPLALPLPECRTAASLRPGPSDQ